MDKMTTSPQLMFKYKDHADNKKQGKDGVNDL